MEDILTMIQNVSAICASNEYEKFRLEEELLHNLTRKQEASTKLKKRAIKKIAEINRKQLELLGHS